MRCKNQHQRTRYLSQERGVRQGCCLSPHYLTSISMNWRSVWSDLQPLASLYTTHSQIIGCVPLNMDLLEQYCQTWALTVHLKKTNIMIFQKRSRSQGTQHTLGTNQITHISHYNYLLDMGENNRRFPFLGHF